MEIGNLGQPIFAKTTKLQSPQVERLQLTERHHDEQLQDIACTIRHHSVDCGSIGGCYHVSSHRYPPRKQCSATHHGGSGTPAATARQSARRAASFTGNSLAASFSAKRRKRPSTQALSDVHLNAYTCASADVAKGQGHRAAMCGESFAMNWRSFFGRLASMPVGNAACKTNRRGKTERVQLAPAK
jgi:hypothetical protein